MGRTGQGCLNASARFAQMHGVRANVANFQNPILAQGMLNGEVPLLGVRNHEMSGNRKAENVLRRQHARTAVGADIIGKYRRVAAGETLELSEAGYEVRIKHAGLRQRIETGFEKIG